ncbi:transglycosylase SLT domain-containing protein [Nocardia paucivorans]|uniref:transglycosylase SLT domain-containing protein n=1 Tax=Nocardia paucivorans TaxID=114259 RepID=UPI0005939A9F|nr:transglycosylase SLT domain-containing protein [Nocardia paucivorans]
MPASHISFRRRSFRNGAALAAAFGALALGPSAAAAVADDGAPALSSQSVQPISSSAHGNNLDGWINQALAIMRANGIPGSYDGIYRNVMRESGGDPHAINLSDSNAAAGTPSKGLLQVIDPTFNAYHVGGTAFDIWDPVANITAACNYAANRYGSIDNVYGAY